MSVILTILVIVMSSLYLGEKRKARVLTKKTEELSNVLHLETWGVPSNLYSDIYNQKNIASVLPMRKSNPVVEENTPKYVQDCIDDATLTFLNSLEVSASKTNNEENMF